MCKECEKKTYYITTPIYYPSDNLHIGHAYCSTAADSMARFKKMTGYDTFFLTGTDEHGQKIERKASDKGVTPQAYVDEIVSGIKDLWKLMDIDYDGFCRTTDEKHVRCVQKIFNDLYERGEIYLASYEGWYCVPCEAYWTDLQLVDGCCPDCGRPVERAKDEAYFLKVGQYAPWLIQYIKDHPDFIQPASRAHEMVKNFLEPGLEDLCVTRTSVKWGIPVPFAPQHTIYVWLDALTNYLSALGYGEEDDSLFRRYWPADVHLVGKEIIRFHTIILPIVLHMLGLPQPKQVFGHGWLVIDGGKMSKSLGNVVDPVLLCNRYGSDAVRYYLMREMPFGSDGEFTLKAFLTRLNADLANDLGNLVSRTVAMIEKYTSGEIPAPDAVDDVDRGMWQLAEETPEQLEREMDGLHFSAGLQAVWDMVKASNRYIDLTQPWVLGRDETGLPKLKTVLFTLAESVRRIAVMIGFVMPQTPGRIFEQLGIVSPELMTWESVCVPFESLPAGLRVHKGEALFPRMDIQKELETGKEIVPTARETLDTTEKKQPASKKQKADVKKKVREYPDEISIDEFSRCRIQVASVLECERVEKSSKLLKFLLQLGPISNDDKDRIIMVLSGIARYYEPESLIGKQVLVVTNLKPAVIAGMTSQGMILTAEDGEGRVRLLGVDGDIASGALIG